MLRKTAGNKQTQDKVSHTFKWIKTIKN